MIPIKLQLRNFLSYGSSEQIIEFGPYPLICLSGKNGHGKSALLDAMTWAVWGQARKISGVGKPDENLLHLGKTSMSVSFDFTFNNQQYRIKRDFGLSGQNKSYSALHFGIVDPSSQELHALTETTIRKTQARIEQTIGLDYDAFVNSAFLRQSNANEFSKKSPKERKDILASILGLGSYEEIRKRASEKHKITQGGIATLKQLQERIEAELLSKESLHKDIIICNHKLEELGKEELTLKTELATLDEKKVIAQTALQHKERILYQQEHQKKEQSSDQEQLLVQFTAWRMVNRAQKKLPNIALQQQQKDALLKKIALHQKTLQEELEHKDATLQLKEALHKQERSIALQQEQLMLTQKTVLERLHLELNAAQKSHIDLQRQIAVEQANKDMLQKELTAILTEQKRLQASRAFGDKDLKQFEKRKQMYHTWVATAKQLTAQRTELQQKNALADDLDNPSCPLCEQNLSAARKRFLSSKFTKLDSFYAHQYNRLVNVLKKLKTILVEQHKLQEQDLAITKELDTLSTQYDERNKVVITLEAALLQRNKELSLTSEMIVQLNKKYEEQLQVVEKQVAAGTDALKLDTTYQQLLAQYNQITTKAQRYNNQEHQKDLQALELLHQEEQKARELTQQITLQQDRKEKIVQLCHSLKSIKKQLIKLSQELQLHEKTLTDLADVKAIEKRIEEQKATLYQKKEELFQLQGRYKEAMAHLNKQEVLHQQQATQLQQAQLEVEDYQNIVTALGKDGIQALLIEETIPEIEQEANNLLTRLTDNQTHIMIESLRDLKKGGTKETLDITISDPIGIRPYELYSGGEAFRIDFALRIAISKLLARRAGTSLQTLIIDEGFGSQDDEGLQRIMDALYKIQDDFKKIIIVSHLPAMKDQFPVHFYVEKKAQGSTVTVMEQG